MVLLCAKHHHLVHEGRWRIDRDTDLDSAESAGVRVVAQVHLVHPTT
jgi:hypothetical protein